MSRSVLVIAYFFPPLGGAGVQRTLKALRYLPEQGWSATVITTGANTYGVSDPSLAAEIPAGTRVVRAFESRRLHRIQQLAVIAFNRLRLATLRDLAGWPDLMVGWGPFALAAAIREIRRARPDVIYSTAPPHTAHVVAAIAAAVTRTPCVLDFRDEWSTNPHGEQPELVRRMNRALERAVVRTATRVTIAAGYFSIAGTAREAPAIIENGVDEADVIDAPSVRRTGGPLRLSHVGTLYGDRDCEPVLAALRRLIAQGRLDPGALELRVVGNDWLPDLEQRVPVPLIRTGYVEHPAAVAEMRSADALLLYVAAGSLAPSGKLFEYLASGRPIVCVTDRDNLAARLVTDWEAGWWADPADDRAIERALLEIVERHRRGTLDVSPEVRARTLARYSRRALAGRLAAVLDDAASQGRARSR
jgi:glycosyltransferase involved in cell wall biosynthesis